MHGCPKGYPCIIYDGIGVDYVSGIVHGYIEEYIKTITPRGEGLLEEMEKYATAEHIPIISNEVAQLLKILVSLKKPDYILELGTAIGYSALVMAGAHTGMKKLFTIERREDRVLEAKNYIERAGESSRIEIIKGDVEEILKEWEKPVDLIFMDAAKGHYESFFALCEKHLKPGGLMICDNVLYQGMVANDDLVLRRKKTIVQRLRRFLPKLAGMENYETVVLPVHDGIALLKKEE